MSTSDFLEIFGSQSNCGEKVRFAPPADAHESSPPYLFEKQNVLEKISSDLATLAVEPELDILPGAGAQMKKEPELSLKFRSGAGAMAI